MQALSALTWHAKLAWVVPKLEHSYCMQFACSGLRGVSPVATEPRPVVAVRTQRARSTPPPSAQCTAYRQLSISMRTRTGDAHSTKVSSALSRFHAHSRNCRDVVSVDLLWGREFCAAEVAPHRLPTVVRGERRTRQSWNSPRHTSTHRHTLESACRWGRGGRRDEGGHRLSPAHGITVFSVLFECFVVFGEFISCAATFNT